MPNLTDDLTRWIPPLSAGDRTRARRAASGLPFVLAVVLLLLLPVVAGACGVSTAGGGDSSGTPTTSSTATATATPVRATPTPYVVFQARGDTHFVQDCQTPSTILPGLAIIIDNTASNRAVDWTVQIRQTIGASGQLWAAASPDHGTVAAGGTATLTITPRSSICTLSQNVVPDATYEALIGGAPQGIGLLRTSGHALGLPITPRGAWDIQVLDTVKSPIPG
jgi:hypothetical protein